MNTTPEPDPLPLDDVDTLVELTNQLNAQAAQSHLVLAISSTEGDTPGDGINEITYAIELRAGTLKPLQVEPVPVNATAAAADQATSPAAKQAVKDAFVTFVSTLVDDAEALCRAEVFVKKEKIEIVLLRGVDPFEPRGTQVEAPVEAAAPAPAATPPPATPAPSTAAPPATPAPAAVAPPTTPAPATAAPPRTPAPAVAPAPRPPAPPPTPAGSSKSFADFMPFIFEWEGETFENDPDDPGGATKFGIDQRSHRNVDIRNLTKVGATAIYWQEWQADGCTTMASPYAEVFFNCAVNMGLGRARGFANVTGKDASAFLSLQEAYYRRLAQSPKRAKYLKGWLNRTGALRRRFGL